MHHLIGQISELESKVFTNCIKPLENAKGKPGFQFAALKTFSMMRLVDWKTKKGLKIAIIEWKGASSFTR